MTDDLANLGTTDSGPITSDAVKGGRTTNSPPSNVKVDLSEAGQVLTSGVDSLVLAVNLEWRGTAFFQSLDEAKKQAAERETAVPIIVHTPDQTDFLIFNVQAFGKEGFCWLLGNHDYFIKLTNTMKPRSRPSAMVEIRSETLWRLGVVEAVDRILLFLAGAGSKVLEVKASRTDLCLDILLPQSLWRYSMLDHIVTRATYDNAHRVRRKFSGLSVGKGQLSCRVYDKGKEITSVSKKDWMLDIWKLNEVPQEAIAARVEFQIRREALKELGIDTVWSLFNHGRNLWSYCVQHWLKLVDKPEIHHTQQTVLPWWKTVQENFFNGPEAHPLIRAKTVRIDKERLAQQMIGQLSSLIAIDDDTGDISDNRTIDLKDHIGKVEECAELIGMNPKKLGKKVVTKIAKYIRTAEKLREAEIERKLLGLPQNRKTPGKAIPI